MEGGNGEVKTGDVKSVRGVWQSGRDWLVVLGACGETTRKEDK